MKAFFVILLFLGLKASAQTDTTTNPFIVVSKQFVDKYNKGRLKVGVNEFFAVETKDGRWVASSNILDEFAVVLQTELNITKTNAQIVRLRRSDFFEMTGVEGGTTTKTQ